MSAANTLPLFPVPTRPQLATPSIIIATTAAILCHQHLGEALKCGGWTTEGGQEIGELIAASRAISERLQAMLKPAGGKR